MRTIKVSNKRSSKCLFKKAFLIKVQTPSPKTSQKCLKKKCRNPFGLEVLNAFMNFKASHTFCLEISFNKLRIASTLSTVELGNWITLLCLTSSSEIKKLLEKPHSFSFNNMTIYAPKTTRNMKASILFLFHLIKVWAWTKMCFYHQTSPNSL